jgi:parafibromin
MGKSKGRPGAVASIPQNPALVSLPKKAGRRPDPIILLSPSASSLLRMSNVKRFLGEGKYVPPDHPDAGGSSDINLLHITRIIPSIDPTREIRFILVESPDQFKPDYWSRLVAVFTTGQPWQFKSYKWSNPPDLFRHALGLYVGWDGDVLPANVKGWGRGVRSVQIEKWNNNAAQTRWRDRQVVESVWGAIEDFMKTKGWSRDSGPAVT